MKIALCLSGETRMFNDFDNSPSEGPQHFYKMLKNFYPDIDVYGHTWSHCDIPVTTAFEFKQLLIEDQKIIDDWVSEDFVNRAFSNRMQWNKQHVLRDQTPDSFVAESLRRSRYAYGQLFSAYHCFALVNQEYDIVIRYRWDLGCMSYADRVNFSNMDEVEFFKHTVVSEIERLMARQHQQAQIPTVITSTNCVIFSGNPPAIQIEDTFYMFNRMSYSALSFDSDNRPTTIEQLLAVIFETTWGNEKPSAHTLWANCLFSHRLELQMTLPNMFWLHRNVDKQHLYDPNN
jgi:hypothetical protein